MESQHVEAYTAGIDEAGRGPLAGPVVAAAVVLDPACVPEGLRDSKKLSEKKRERLAVEIRQDALAIGVGIIHEQDIDRKNILQATFQAMRDSVNALEVEVTHLVVDGNHKIPDLELPQEAIVGGDDLHPAISAASIIAKTTRDAMMRSYDILFPKYGFASHKGYGSAKHLGAIREHGRSPIHRRSFRPINDHPNREFQYYERPENHGYMGEILAGMYLIRKGYQLLAHRYKAGRISEIDLIATHSNTLHFIEVKAFSGRVTETEALGRVDARKQAQLASGAEQYLNPQSDGVKTAVGGDPGEVNVMFDLVTVQFTDRKPIIHHYINAFNPV